MLKSTYSSNKKNSWALGLFMLSIVVVAWVSSSFLLNSIFESNYYKKPIFITFCSVSSCSLYLLPLLKQLIRLFWTNGGHWDIQTAYKLQYYPHSTELNSDNEKSDQSEKSYNGNAVDDQIIPLSSIIKLSMIFCTLWFAANVTTNTSLSYTSVTSQTILSSTASFFTLFFSVIMKVDTINLNKLLGLIISFVGIVIVVVKSTPVSNQSNIDQFSYTSIIIGNILALLGALIYGIYSTFFKRSLTHISNIGNSTYKASSSNIDIKLYLGFVGLFTFVGLWPVLILFDYFGWETFEFKWDVRVISVIIMNSSVTFLSDYCWARAVILTSPLTVTMGLSFTMPLAMFGDFIFKGKQITLWYMLGSILIVLSFVLINANSDSDTDDGQAKLLNDYNVESYGTIEV